MCLVVLMISYKPFYETLFKKGRPNLAWSSSKVSPPIPYIVSNEGKLSAPKPLMLFAMLSAARFKTSFDLKKNNQRKWLSLISHQTIAQDCISPPSRFLIFTKDQTKPTKRPALLVLCRPFLLSTAEFLWKAQKNPTVDKNGKLNLPSFISLCRFVRFNMR